MSALLIVLIVLASLTAYFAVGFLMAVLMTPLLVSEYTVDYGRDSYLDKGCMDDAQWLIYWLWPVTALTFPASAAFRKIRERGDRAGVRGNQQS